MKVVIDIPEDVYKEIVNDEEYGIERVRKAIINGTLLPKNHGRLIDADELIEMYKKDCGRRIYADNFIFDVEHNSTTIIEADNGG